MADQLLSVNDANIQSVANAIKDKAGISRSVPLEFPSDFVDTLQGITTEATITPKISPQQVTLTKDSTSFPIAAGFHNGADTISINLQSKTVTPGDSQQDVVPDPNMLLTQVIVNAVSSGYKMATGTITVSESESFSISGLSFTPSICCLLLKTWVSGGSRSPYWVVSHYKGDATTQADSTKHAYKASSSSHDPSLISSSNQDMIYSNNSVTFYKAAGQYSGYRYQGEYVYVIWGN